MIQRENKVRNGVEKMQRGREMMERIAILNQMAREGRAPAEI